MLHSTRRYVFRFTVAVLSIVAVPPPLHAQPAEVVAGLEALVARTRDGTQVGLVVLDVASGQPWFEHQPDLPLKPASVQKLFTTAAALERFGPGFRFETRLLLRGDELWVIGAGDPALGDPRLGERDGRDLEKLYDAWAQALRDRGVSRVSRIVLDDSIFDRQHRHPDWPDDQADRWYQAPPGGLNVNDNCLDITVVRSKEGAELRLQPDLPPEQVVRKNDRNGKLVVERNGEGGFVVSGSLRNGALDPVATDDPTAFFGHALRRALEKRRIAAGPAERRKLSAQELSAATPLATFSTPLPDVLWRCNTHSQNLFAECLVKALAAYGPDGRPTGTPGSWAGGAQVAVETLRRVGVDLGTALLRDGSGLSHTNRVTARQVAGLLATMHRRPQAEVFRASLAAAGEPGSMKNRYGDPALRGRLRGKTGSIANVSTLAGYATRDDGTVLAFAVLVNGSAGTDLPLAVCKTLVGAPEAEKKPAPSGKNSKKPSGKRKR